MAISTLAPHTRPHPKCSAILTRQALDRIENPTRIYRTWADRIAQPVMQKTHIQRLGHYLSGHGNTTNLTREEIDTLGELVDERSGGPCGSEPGMYGIEPDHALQGITWLRNRCFTPTGRARKNAPLDEYDRELLANYSHFEFRGYDEHPPTSPYHVYNIHRPAWRLVTTDGRHLTYTAWPWVTLSDGSGERRQMDVLFRGSYE